MLIPLILTSLALLLYAAPEFPGVKTLRRFLVEQPARFLSGLSPAKVLFWLGLAVTAAVLIGLFQAEGAKLFTMMAPDTIMWFAMFDVATLTDALIFALVVSSSVKLHAVLGLAKAALRPVRDLILRQARRSARDRAATTRKAAVRKPSHADDPEGWRGGFAYAG